MPHPTDQRPPIQTQPPSELQFLFQKGWEWFRDGVNDTMINGEWVLTVSEGVIFLRHKKTSKWPEHDKSPEKKKQERSENG